MANPDTRIVRNGPLPSGCMGTKVLGEIKTSNGYMFDSRNMVSSLKDVTFPQPKR